MIGIAVLVLLPLAAVAVLNGTRDAVTPTPLQSAVDDRLPVAGARNGTSYVIRSLRLSPHSAARWYVDVAGSAKGKGAGYVGSVDGVVPGLPCGPGPQAEVVRSRLVPREGDEGYGTGDAEAVAAAMAQAAVRLVGEACAALSAKG